MRHDGWKPEQTTIARQRLRKRAPSITDTRSTIEEMFDAVFYAVRAEVTEWGPVDKSHESEVDSRVSDYYHSGSFSCTVRRRYQATTSEAIEDLMFVVVTMSNM